MASMTSTSKSAAAARLDRLAAHLHGGSIGSSLPSADGAVSPDDAATFTLTAEGLATEFTSASTSPNPDDVVIVSALRTPIGRAKRGAFKDTTPDVLLRTVLSETVRRTAVPIEHVGDICVGNVLEPGAGANMARMAQFCAGIPETVPLSVVNRQCSSGLQAVLNIAGNIRSRMYCTGIAAGVESMSMNSMGSAAPKVDWEKVGESPLAQECLVPMGITSENVASRFGITREKQDELAELSHRRAAAAQAAGKFDAEIVPVTTVVKDADGNEETVTVSKDEGVRPTTTVEKLGKLRPAFTPEGSTTAGNSSQVSDGAAAVLLMRRSRATELGLPVLGTLRGSAVAGVKPDVMGIGPAVAIPKALKNAGLSSVHDVDIYEINEAFASQAVYCVEKLGIPMEKVNPNGGAIALGHPLGCTGARQVATLLHELQRTKGRYGVVSMCIGTGMGLAAVFEAEH